MTEITDQDIPGVDAVPVDADQREALIREAAFRMYEEEGHPADCAVRHWLAAEVEIDRLLVEQRAMHALPDLEGEPADH